MPATTQKQEAMQAVRLLYKWAVKAAVHEPEALYQARQMLEGFIEDAVTPSKPQQWYPSDKPWNDNNIGGFTLLDEVKVMNSRARWFVVGLDFGSDELILNMTDYHQPLLQERYKSDSLTLVTHGKIE